MLRPVVFRYLAISMICGILGSGIMGLSANSVAAQVGAIQFVPPQTEEESDPRDRPRGGGSRPICNQSDPQDLKCIQRSMVALVPQSHTAAWGLTRSATPMIWFFSPYTSEIPIQSSFELVDQSGQLIWQESGIQLPSKSGIFAYQIPAQAQLTSGETYRWYFNVQLDSEQPAADVLLSARLTYQTPQTSSPSSPLSLAQIQRLANQGLWYDTLSELAQVSRDHETLWENFLIKNGFPDLIKEPIHSPTQPAIS